MSRAKRIFKLIAARHPDLILCQDRLVVVPTDQILRGFLLDTTSSKDMVNVVCLVMPLYQPREHEYLQYSSVIAYTHVDRKAYQESADKIDSIITPHISILRGISRARDFLRHIDRMIGNDSVSIQFDLALTYHRIGDVERAISIMKTLGPAIDRWYEAYGWQKKAGGNPFEDLVIQTAQRMIADPVGFAAVLDEWQEVNVRMFALQPTRVPIGV